MNYGRIRTEPFHLTAITQQSHHTVADQVCRGFLTTDHGHDEVGNDLFFA